MPWEDACWIRSPTRPSPSSKLYSEWQCKWTNSLTGLPPTTWMWIMRRAERSGKQKTDRGGGRGNPAGTAAGAPAAGSVPPAASASEVVLAVYRVRRGGDRETRAAPPAIWGFLSFIVHPWIHNARA